MPFAQIPRKLHVIWVGDETKRPDRWIQTWRDKHPSWEFRLWGNEEYDRIPWRGKVQMDIFRAAGCFDGVADLMRYEILHEHGGVYVDADSTCLRPLDDWLMDTRLFAAWENETQCPGLIANTFIGCLPRHPALAALIDATSRMCNQVYRRNWRKLYWDGLRPRFEYEGFLPWHTVGPVLFTEMVLPYCPMDATILPSVMFLPKHHHSDVERESSLIYARHEWGSTHESY